jgi:glycosyltransferase involved in cell wall biosynthesis
MAKAKSKTKKISAEGNPLVSVCTPTFNRRSFIPGLINCFNAQSYPKAKMEWIIADDGTDPVGDLFNEVEQAKYFRLEEKMSIGQKRNFMHSKASGDIIVYMDDDDYYPPDRVLHAVNTLRTKKNFLIAGSSIMYIYFKDLDKIYQFGPYWANHATAATFAFKKELLDLTAYSDDAEVSEERFFLKDYSIPLVQLEPKKSILVFNHSANTYNRKNLLKDQAKNNIKETKFKPKNFIKDESLLNFYLDQVK